MSTSITSNKLESQQTNITAFDPIALASQKNTALTQEQLSLLTSFFSTTPSGLSGTKPKLQMPSLADTNALTGSTTIQTSALSLESLMSALNFNERKQAVRDGLESIEARGKEKAELNQERIQALQENLAKENSPAQKFLKAFQIIGVIVSTVASLCIAGASIASTAVSGGATAALVVGSALMVASSINSLVSIISDGEHSISAAIGKAAEGSMSPEAAKWLGVAVELSISIAGMVCSLGGSIATGAKEIVTSGTKLLNTTIKISTLAAAGATMATGGTQIAQAVIDKEIADNQAFMKELEAILLAIQNADDRDLDFVQSQIELSNALLESLNSIVATNNQANTAIMTATPAMA